MEKIKLAYRRIGSGKPLMLIHGFPLDHSIWDKTAEAAQHDFDLILPDLRGFGLSPQVNSPYGIADMADDLAGLLDSLGVEKIALAGHSMGGYVALSFAEKYPQRVSALGLVSSQSLADSPERKAGRYNTAEQVLENGAGVVADSMAAKFSANKNVQDEIRELILKQNKNGIAAALKAMAERKDLTPLLNQFPVVLIHGDADELISIDRAREAKSAFPNAQLSVLPNVGHAPMMDAPEKTAEALKLLK